ncbi:MAG: T9SS type A sorting domain-containing protein [Marinilabiliaceae bacterium]|nr:T9SS type A sorting domain-containing protein [Marinilabiliaceae bacterium]
MNTRIFLLSCIILLCTINIAEGQNTNTYTYTNNCDDNEISYVVMVNESLWSVCHCDAQNPSWVKEREFGFFNENRNSYKDQKYYDYGWFKKFEQGGVNDFIYVIGSDWKNSTQQFRQTVEMKTNVNKKKKGCDEEQSEIIDIEPDVYDVISREISCDQGKCNLNHTESFTLTTKIVVDDVPFLSQIESKKGTEIVDVNVDENDYFSFSLINRKQVGIVRYFCKFNGDGEIIELTDKVRIIKCEGHDEVVVSLSDIPPVNRYSERIGKKVEFWVEETMIDGVPRESNRVYCKFNKQAPNFTAEIKLAACSKYILTVRLKDPSESVYMQDIMCYLENNLSENEDVIACEMNVKSSDYKKGIFIYETKDRYFGTVKGFSEYFVLLQGNNFSSGPTDQQNDESTTGSKREVKVERITGSKNEVEAEQIVVYDDASEQYTSYVTNSESEYHVSIKITDDSNEPRTNYRVYKANEKEIKVSDKVVLEISNNDVNNFKPEDKVAFINDNDKELDNINIWESKYKESWKEYYKQELRNKFLPTQVNGINELKVSSECNEKTTHVTIAIPNQDKSGFYYFRDNETLTRDKGWTGTPHPCNGKSILFDDNRDYYNYLVKTIKPESWKYESSDWGYEKRRAVQTSTNQGTKTHFFSYSNNGDIEFEYKVDENSYKITETVKSSGIKYEIYDYDACWLRCSSGSDYLVFDLFQEQQIQQRLVKYKHGIPTSQGGNFIYLDTDGNYIHTSGKKYYVGKEYSKVINIGSESLEVKKGANIMNQYIDYVVLEKGGNQWKIYLIDDDYINKMYNNKYLFEGIYDNYIDILYKSFLLNEGGFQLNNITPNEVQYWIIEDADGCTSNFKTKLSIPEAPEFSTNILKNPTSLCSNDGLVSFSLDDASNAIWSYNSESESNEDIYKKADGGTLESFDFSTTDSYRISGFVFGENTVTFVNKDNPKISHNVSVTLGMNLVSTPTISGFACGTISVNGIPPSNKTFKLKKNVGGLNDCDNITASVEEGVYKFAGLESGQYTVVITENECGNEVKGSVEVTSKSYELKKVDLSDVTSFDAKDGSVSLSLKFDGEDANDCIEVYCEGKLIEKTKSSVIEGVNYNSYQNLQAGTYIVKDKSSGCELDKFTIKEPSLKVSLSSEYIVGNKDYIVSGIPEFLNIDEGDAKLFFKETDGSENVYMTQNNDETTGKLYAKLNPEKTYDLYFEYKNMSRCLISAIKPPVIKKDITYKEDFHCIGEPSNMTINIKDDDSYILVKGEKANLDLRYDRGRDYVFTFEKPENGESITLPHPIVNESGNFMFKERGIGVSLNITVKEYLEAKYNNSLKKASWKSFGSPDVIGCNEQTSKLELSVDAQNCGYVSYKIIDGNEQPKLEDEISSSDEFVVSLSEGTYTVLLLQKEFDKKENKCISKSIDERSITVKSAPVFDFSLSVIKDPLCEGKEQGEVKISMIVDETSDQEDEYFYSINLSDEVNSSDDGPNLQKLIHKYNSGEILDETENSIIDSRRVFMNADKFLTDLSAGIYTVTLYHEKRCPVSKLVELNPYKNPYVDEYFTSDVTCHGGENGIITITKVVKNSSCNVTHYKINDSAWEPINNENDINILGLAAKNAEGEDLYYTIELKDNNGCETTGDDKKIIKIEEPDPVELKPSNITQTIQYYNGTGGYVELTASGGNNSNGYTLYIDDIEQEGTLKENEPKSLGNIFTAKTYTFYGKDTKGCQSGPVQIAFEGPDTPLTFEYITTPAACKAATGTMTITPSGGWGAPYKIGIVGNGLKLEREPDSSVTFESLLGGTYEVAVTDKEGGKISGTVTIDDNVIEAIYTKDVTTCNNDGSVTLKISGGNLSVGSTYKITNTKTDEVKTGNEVSFDKLSAGEYIFEISDNNGCTNNATITVKDGSMIVEPEVVSYATTNESADGKLSAIVSKGSGDYTYSWVKVDEPNKDKVVSTSKTAENLSVGVYQLEVSDGVCAYKSGLITLTSYISDILRIVKIGHQTKSDENDGSVCIERDGDIGGRKIELLYESYGVIDVNPIVVDNRVMFNDLKPGNYSVKIVGEDDKFEGGVSFTIEKYEEMQLEVGNKLDVSKKGYSDGSIQLTLKGGVAPYVIMVDEEPDEMINNSFTLENLTAGKYNIKVTDAFNNVLSKTYEINEPESNLSFSYTMNPVSCYALDDGLVQLVAKGGWRNYQYRINGGKFGNSPYFPNLEAGTYSFEVMDGRGVTYAREISVTQPEPLEVVKVVTEDVSCKGLSDGAVHVVVEGGNGGYKIQKPEMSDWLDGTSYDSQMAGTYLFNIKDSKGCSVNSIETVIEEPEALVITAMDVTNTTCSKDNGSIVVTSDGGTLPYSYQWTENGGLMSDITPNVSGLKQGGYYDVEVTDKNGCRDKKSSVIEKSTIPRVKAVKSDPVLCYGYSDGRAWVEESDVEVAYPASPYHIYWENGEEGMSTSGLASGVHKVLIKDDNGCESEKSFDVMTPSPVTIDLMIRRDATCYGYSDAKLRVEGRGGVGEYSYQWSQGSSTEVADNLKAGEYKVIVTDANNCVAEGVYEVSEPEQLTVYAGEDITICPGNTYLFSTGIYSTYEWKNGKDEVLSCKNTFEASEEGAYHLTVTDEAGCFAHDDVSLTIGNDALKTDFLMPASASIEDEVVIIELSNMELDNKQWDYPTEVFTDVTKEDDESYILRIKPNSVGTYEVSLWANSSGCTSSRHKTIEIVSDAEDEEIVSDLGYDPIIRKFVVSPNPTSGLITAKIELRDKLQAEVRIYDVTNGRKVRMESLSDDSRYNVQFDLSTEISGIYLVTLDAEREHRSVKIIVK